MPPIVSTAGHDQSGNPATDHTLQNMDPGQFAFDTNLNRAVVCTASGNPSTLSPLKMEYEQIVSATGATAIAIKEGTVFVTATGVAAMTIVPPAMGADDNKTLKIVSLSAHAHTVVVSTTPFNGGSFSTATFTATVPDNLTLTAYSGVWYVTGNVGITLST